MTAMHLSCMHVDLFITLNNAILLVALITRKYGIYCLKHKQYNLSYHPQQSDLKSEV